MNRTLCLFACLLIGCGPDLKEKEVGVAAKKEELFALQLLRAYVIDGTSNTRASNTIISTIVDKSATFGAVYEEGPDWNCSNCEEITERVANRICGEMRLQLFRGFAVYGYSRGAFMVHEAALRAFARCPDAFDVPGKPREISNKYLFAGFFDAVETNIWNYSKTMPANTRWLHLHRANTLNGTTATAICPWWIGMPTFGLGCFAWVNAASAAFNTQFFNGGAGWNQPFSAHPELHHDEFGYMYRDQLMSLMRGAANGSGNFLNP